MRQLFLLLPEAQATETALVLQTAQIAMHQEQAEAFALRALADSVLGTQYHNAQLQYLGARAHKQDLKGQDCCSLLI